jgi:hypothetical protein
MQVNTVPVGLSIAKSHYVGWLHVTIYGAWLQSQEIECFYLEMFNST